jgi:RNA recognition motif-containing protein
LKTTALLSIPFNKLPYCSPIKNLDLSDEKMDAIEENFKESNGDGLPLEAKEAETKEHFGQFGEIETATLKTDMATGRSRGMNLRQHLYYTSD